MWRFVHLTDTHLASTRDGVWNNNFLCTMMPDVMACLRGDLAQLQPDFILVTGDIVSHQTRAAMFEARDLMESLGFPYYPMGGNHDFVVEDSRAWFLEAFKHRLPKRDTVYSFTHKGLHFCVLDAWWVWSDHSLSQVSEKTVAANLDTSLGGARWALPETQLTWLAEDLDRHRELPTFVAVHYPAIPIPERMCRPDMQDAGHLENGGELVDLLRRYPQVRGVFSGHVHMHFIEVQSGITHVVTGAMPEYPTEYREVRVYEDRLEIETHSLSDPAFAKRSLIPGKAWTAGTPQDRSAVITLTSGKWGGLFGEQRRGALTKRTPLDFIMSLQERR